MGSPTACGDAPVRADGSAGRARAPAAAAAARAAAPAALGPSTCRAPSRARCDELFAARKGPLVDAEPVTQAVKLPHAAPGTAVERGDQITGHRVGTNALRRGTVGGVQVPNRLGVVRSAICAQAWARARTSARHCGVSRRRPVRGRLPRPGVECASSLRRSRDSVCADVRRTSPTISAGRVVSVCLSVTAGVSSSTPAVSTDKVRRRAASRIVP